ncbi:hypothetical protein IEO21_04125 [Rhodonia placenta]|uniref:Uncharacterized protein n=1 Tax=Rhodonia placenta TaxID=104341 RepID=A0A8H7P4D5_9APHY|nr:hypothetical protein IEO21_04125 [Postia placenta]
MLRGLGLPADTTRASASMRSSACADAILTSGKLRRWSAAVVPRWQTRRRRGGCSVCSSAVPAAVFRDVRSWSHRWLGGRRLVPGQRTARWRPVPSVRSRLTSVASAPGTVPSTCGALAYRRVQCGGKTLFWSRGTALWATCPADDGQGVVSQGLLDVGSCFTHDVERISPSFRVKVSCCGHLTRPWSRPGRAARDTHSWDFEAQCQRFARR